MRILLQDTATGLYLARGGSWTDQPEAALAFLNEIRAKDHSIYHRLAHTQVVMLAEPSASVTAADQPTPTRLVTEAASQIDRGAKTEIALRAAQSPDRRPIETTARAPGRQTRRAPARQQRTLVHAAIDVGFGNSLFIRGEGGGLSWEKGQPLTCVNGTAWRWSSQQARDKVVFKLLLNDTVWAKGDNFEVAAGQTARLVPQF